MLDPGKKRILFCCPEYPFPPNSGGKVAHINHINSLKELGHKLKLVFFDTEQIATSNDNSDDVVVYKKELILNESRLAKAAKFYFNVFFTALPRAFFIRSVPKLHIDMKKYIANGNYDLVVFDHLNSFSFCRAIKPDGKIKYLYIAHNIESKLSYEEYKLGKSLLQKIVLYVDYLKVRYYENKIIKNSNAVITISSYDHQLLISKYPPKKIINIPELIAPKTSGWHYNGSKRIVFIGSTLHFPNFIAVQWLVETLMPKLLAKDHSVTLSIIGNTGNYLNQSFIPASITFEGMVTDEQLNKICCESSLFLSPVTLGSGTKIKVLQAASIGMPILSTQESLLGNDFLDKELFAIDINDLNKTVNRVLEVLNSQMIQNTMSKIARMALNTAWEKNQDLWRTSFSDL